jgi:hypothetical protein
MNACITNDCARAWRIGICWVRKPIMGIASPVFGLMT